MRITRALPFLGLVILLSLPLALTAFAAGSGDHHGGIPTVLWLQVVNFVLYVGLLVYLLRKPVRSFFEGRVENYNSALKRAEAQKREAETKRREIQERLTRLESTSAQSIAEARAEAEALRQRVLVEAKELSEKLRAEAQRTAQIELERAKFALRQEMLSQSVQLASKILADKIQEPDQKRLQSEFVEKIQVVNQ
ncbi:MAG TPA: ATP synthase F0 subunit B [Pseudobdellovibrionaceae bacterium]|nr:ATP synthase F0 subunit B [Pseudobdellovibrionaceae bacterium]